MYIYNTSVYVNFFYNKNNNHGNPKTKHSNGIQINHRQH